MESVCQKWGRQRDLRILDLDTAAPHATIRWNPLDSPDDEFELAARCGTVMEMLGMRETQSSYWLESSRQFIANAITLVRLTSAWDQPPSFAEIGRLSTCPRELMERLARLDTPQPDRKTCACLDYFADVWLSLDEKLRTDIMSFIRNLVQPFLRQPYAPIFSGRSTLSIGQMIDAGAIFYLNLPTARHPAMARAVGTFVKLEYFQEVRRRLDKPRPSFLLCDEYSEFVSFGEGQPDASFFAMSRQSNHANIVAVQNINSFLMHSRDQAPVLNLLGNCAVKVFLRNTDQKTNEYASELHGQEIVEAQAITVGAPGGNRRGKATSSITGSDQFCHVLRPEAFTRLKVPGTEPGTLFAESIIHLGSRHEVSRRARKTRWPVHPLGSARCAPDAGTRGSVERTGQDLSS
jgi:type IV secretory pathway TraG/TraD family ATPase VirD4